MASPTTTTLVAAILWRRFSIRSRVSTSKCGMWNVECEMYRWASCRKRPSIDIPHSAFCISNSWDPPFLLRPPLQRDRPHPPRFLRAVRDPVHAAIARECPATAHHSASRGEPDGACDGAGKEG